MLIAMPMVKYHQVYLVLREQLHEGKFSQGLPGEVALKQQFGAARSWHTRLGTWCVQHGKSD